MRHESSRILFEYWNEVRAGRIAPRRFEIEPSRIAPVLPDAFILERADSATYRFRIAGTRLCEHIGRELRGVNILDGWPLADRATLAQHLTTLSTRGGALAATFDAAGDGGRRATFELLVLPLVHSQGMIERYLGSIAAYETPDWLGVSRLTDYKLLTARIIWPDIETVNGHPAPQPQAPLPLHDASVRVGRLVRSDRRQFRVYDGGRTTEDTRG